MLITRWQAPLRPSKEQAGMILNTEGLEAFEEILQPNQKVAEHRHPFTEVRIVITGELIFNVAGNTVLLREGDRIEIPANPRHSHSCQGQATCVSIFAQKIV